MPDLDLPRIQALCFDVDGTLADTDDEIVERLATFIDKLPFLSGHEASRLARRIVMDAETPVNTLYGLSDRLGIDDELKQAVGYVKSFREKRAEELAEKPELGTDAASDEHRMVPDIKEMLVDLAGHFPISCISTGTEPRIRAFLEHNEIDHLFVAVVGAQTTPRMKPYPDPLEFAAEKMGVAPENCLMIGDTTVDMLTARAAGAQAVGVLCGFGTRDELEREGAALILDTTSDLQAVLDPASVEAEHDDPAESAEPGKDVPAA
jgi:HAD superfamily hydrolase (TIGR01549 family)